MPAPADPPDPAASDPAVWHARTRGREFGPMTGRQLKGAADAGKLAGDAVVRKAGGPWKPAAEVKGLGVDPPAPDPPAETFAELPPAAPARADAGIGLHPDDGAVPLEFADDPAPPADRAAETFDPADVAAALGNAPAGLAATRGPAAGDVPAVHYKGLRALAGAVMIVALLSYALAVLGLAAVLTACADAAFGVLGDSDAAGALAYYGASCLVGGVAAGIVYHAASQLLKAAAQAAEDVRAIRRRLR